MPELPEVETIARSLRNPRDLSYSPNSPMDEKPGIIGRTISHVKVLWERTIAEPSPTIFVEAVSGQTVIDVSRRGKFLVIKISQGCLLLHLRMSGDIRIEPLATEVQAHDRVLLGFADEMRLSFNDTRKFGRLWYVRDPQSVLGKLGPEPLDETLDAGLWYENLKRYKRQLKPLLLDQSFVAGLGNIYTDEALHRAGLHPLRNSGELTESESRCLLDAIRQVLREGIERNGSSIDWVYRGGSFQNQFRVYQQDGKPCATCGTLIERILVGQRGTHFCPHCQPKFP